MVYISNIAEWIAKGESGKERMKKLYENIRSLPRTDDAVLLEYIKWDGTDMMPIKDIALLQAGPMPG